MTYLAPFVPTLLGSWTGTSQLFLPELHTSAVTATVTSVVGGRFLQIAYTWSYEDAPQEGMLLVGEEGTLLADTWHLGAPFLISKPWSNAEPVFCVFATYPVDEGPDWGWRTTIEPGGDRLRIAMYNVPPPDQGEEELGFELLLHRTAEGIG